VMVDGTFQARQHTIAPDARGPKQHEWHRN
jgi:hypothetical protein